MAIALSVLDTITIDTPCTVPWEGMQGDDRTRFCTKCSKHVHDISEMTTAEAVQLMNATEELPCVRLYRRPDGRVVTSDCPKTLRERTWTWLGRRSTLAASLFSLLFLSGCGDNRGKSTHGVTCPRTTQKSTETTLEEFEEVPMPRERSETVPMPHEPTLAKPTTTSLHEM